MKRNGGPELVHPMSVHECQCRVGILPWLPCRGGPHTTMEATCNEMVPTLGIPQTKVVYVDGNVLLKYVEDDLAKVIILKMWQEC